MTLFSQEKFKAVSMLALSNGLPNGTALRKFDNNLNIEERTQMFSSLPILNQHEGGGFLLKLAQVQENLLAAARKKQDTAAPPVNAK